METNDRLPFGIYVRLTAGQPVCADLISSLSPQKPDLSSTSDGHSGRLTVLTGLWPGFYCRRRAVIVSSGQTLRSNGQTLRSNAAGRPSLSAPVKRCGQTVKRFGQTPQVAHVSCCLLPLHGSASGRLLMVGVMCLLIYWQGVSGFSNLCNYM